MRLSAHCAACVFFLVLAATAASVGRYPMPVRLHQTQLVGTYLSTHAVRAYPFLAEWNVTRASLADQHEVQGVRHVELVLSYASGAFKATHVLGYDEASVCAGLVACLQGLFGDGSSSGSSTGFVAVFVRVADTGAVPWTAPIWQAFDNALGLGVGGRSLLTPRAAQGNFSSLGAMVRAGGWPAIAPLARHVLVAVLANSLPPGSTTGSAVAFYAPTYTSGPVDLEAGFVVFDVDSLAVAPADLLRLVSSGVLVRAQADSPVLGAGVASGDAELALLWFDVADVAPTDGRVSLSKIRAFESAMQRTQVASDSAMQAQIDACGGDASGLMRTQSACFLAGVRSALGIELIASFASLTPDALSRARRAGTVFAGGVHFVASGWPVFAPRSGDSAYSVSQHYSSFGPYMCNPVTASAEHLQSCTPSQVNAEARGLCGDNCLACTAPLVCGLCSAGWALGSNGTCVSCKPASERYVASHRPCEVLSSPDASGKNAGMGRGEVALLVAIGVSLVLLLVGAVAMYMRGCPWHSRSPLEPHRLAPLLGSSYASDEELLDLTSDCDADEENGGADESMRDGSNAVDDAAEAGAESVRLGSLQN